MRTGARVAGVSFETNRSYGDIGVANRRGLRRGQLDELNLALHHLGSDSGPLAWGAVSVGEIAPGHGRLGAPVPAAIPAIVITAIGGIYRRRIGLH